MRETDKQPLQRIIKIRRDYNSWVASETLEDFALRYTPRAFRRWSIWQVANTAVGGAASFLVLEAVGATMMVQAGFLNAFWAILASCLVIFLAGWPISVYAARFGVDMDLLTRGAGFGYIGSTISSLVYASFTFIFFALEAAIMAYALELGLGIPPAWGYLLCALVILPLVMHGITTISRLQSWTQPVWFFLLVLPYGFLFWKNAGALAGIWQYGGKQASTGFDLSLFGAAFTVGIALITQMGEQADYLRFMPRRTASTRKRWHVATLIGGVGWLLPGAAKMLGGALLAWLAIRAAIPLERAVDPNQMYLIGFSQVLPAGRWAVVVTVVFVIISQLKINVTNAYAGSLAWSNFFSRLTHSHPGRVVWVVFNTLIALMLMELEVFQALSQVLGLYSNIAISWIMAVVADLVINKPLKLSPPGIEFKRSHLYDINPVGVGAMALASILSVSAHVGLLGQSLKPFAPFIAMLTALITSPLLAWATKGRYYLARQSAPFDGSLHHCVVCEREYEAEDMAHCPAYQGAICSLCCTLDARCDDLCRPQARLSVQWAGLLSRLLPRRVLPYLSRGLGHYLLLMASIMSFLMLLLGLLYYLEIKGHPQTNSLLADTFLRVFASLVLVTSVLAWWMVLTHKSRQVAQEESNRQTQLLMQEIDSHQRTDEQLQKARQVAELANQAKSRYISAISHELRTPLNSILGYAQILDGDPLIPASRQQAIQVIRRSGDHLLSVIEGTIDIARIESGKLTLDTKAMDFAGFIEQIVAMFELQARNKGLDFTYQPPAELPAVVRADEKRLRQILINLLGNAVKYTARGGVIFKLNYLREMAVFEIQDTGPGIPDAEIERIFEPFERGSAVRGGTTGTGLGLTISRMLTDLMGGEMRVTSQIGVGSVFTARLYLPQVHGALADAALPQVTRIGYIGVRRRILVVDNERVDREMLINVLSPLGFLVG
ncbi:MAG: ATP-binding protein, partial [Formivibrio sp.]|nr:ATP-binding protein [Formivibrio sp.]